MVFERQSIEIHIEIQTGEPQYTVMLQSMSASEPPSNRMVTKAFKIHIEAISFACTSANVNDPLVQSPCIFRI